MKAFIRSIWTNLQALYLRGYLSWTRKKQGRILKVNLLKQEKNLSGNDCVFGRAKTRIAFSKDPEEAINRMAEFYLTCDSPIQRQLIWDFTIRKLESIQGNKKASELKSQMN